MGMHLDLYVEDESIESPFLTRGFQDEIIFEGYIKFTDFLSEEENKVVTPNSYGEIVLGTKRKATFFEKAKIPFTLNKAVKGKISIEEINKFRAKLVHRSEKIEDRERDPLQLKEALKKIENHLMFNQNKLPLVHFVYETKELKNEVNSIIINDVKTLIEGDLYFYDNYSEVRNKIHLKSYLDDYGKIDFFVDINPKILIDNKLYFTKTISKAEQFKEDFNRCYHFLDKAINNNQRILWEFD